MTALLNAEGQPRVGLVAIGRNEGERLVRCLQSVDRACPVVYVDSGSTDGSVAFAESLGMTVVSLSTEKGFTAARARNAGWRRLRADHPALEFVQFVDGDCELDAGWLGKALAAIETDDTLCAVFGRRRERFPDASLYNLFCDDEWNVPIGLVNACGGDVLFRMRALVEAGGYNDDLIAGEEPDLCLRLRLEGWILRRIDGEMTLHDANIMTARQWWLRCRRAGHAFAEHVARHGAEADPAWRRQRNSILVWGFVIPAVIVLALLATIASEMIIFALIAVFAIILYPLQVVRIARARVRAGAAPAFARAYAVWTVLAKFAQFGGLLSYYRKRRGGSAPQIIEYKGARPGEAA